MNRICILSLPRSGSQFCENIISNMYEDPPMIMLGEFFHWWKCGIYNNIELDPETKLLVKKINHRTGIDFIERRSKRVKLNIEGWKDNLELLKNMDKTQPVSVRLQVFPYLCNNRLRMLEYRELIYELKALNFKFISLERDFDERVLSLLIANAYAEIKNEYVFPINNIADERVLITEHEISKIEREYINSSKWVESMDRLIGSYGYDSIRYETIYEDLSRVFDREVPKIGGVKTIQDNPYDLIINAEEVEDMIIKTSCYLSRSYIEFNRKYRHAHRRRPKRKTKVNK